MLKRVFAVLSAGLLAVTMSGCAEQAEIPVPDGTMAAEPADAPVLTDYGVDLAGGSVHYPKISGLADEARNDAVNSLLSDTAQIGTLLDRLAVLGSSPVQLNVRYTVMMPDLPDGIVSVLYEMSGPLYDTRASHAWAGAVIDSTTAQAVTPDQLFTDWDTAKRAIETLMEDEIASDISDYLAENALTPLPDSFVIDRAGITFLYPVSQLATLGDKAGAVQVGWFELKDLLCLQDGDILTRIGVRDTFTADAGAIRSCVEAGQLPGIPVTLGGSMKDAVDGWDLRCDADYITNGRSFELEGAAFRGVYLITDMLSDDWDTSVIQEIRSDRMNLNGLMTGITDRSEWFEVLGEPDASVTVDEEKAEGLRMVPGTSDYYTMGEHQLVLHADEDGVLRSILLLD